MANMAVLAVAVVVVALQAHLMMNMYVGYDIDILCIFCSLFH